MRRVLGRLAFACALSLVFALSLSAPVFAGVTQQVAYCGDPVDNPDCNTTGVWAFSGLRALAVEHSLVETGTFVWFEMLERLESFNARLAESGESKHFRMGIGLNTGPVMSGNVGSERRMEYTTIGDTTNTAARLEAATKGTPYQLYLSESTHSALSDRPDDIVFVETLAVRGREQGVNVWGLVEEGEGPPAGSHFESTAPGPGELLH